MVIFIKFIYKQNSLFVTVTFKKKKKIDLEYDTLTII